MTSAAVIAETSAVRGVDETYAAFAHLNAPNAPLYRAILATFVAERARFALALRPSEIQAALAATSTPALPLDDHVDTFVDIGATSEDLEFFCRNDALRR